jgi:outer membrane protein assembly factor BamB
MLWQQQNPSRTHAIHAQNTLASSTPTVDERRVYCAWSTPDEFTLLALYHDGSPAWKIDLGPFVSQHGFGTSPILFGEFLIITNDQDADSFLVAVDRSSGHVRWKSPREHLPEQNACYSTPCIYQPAGRPAELIVCGRLHGITSIDPFTGTTNWEARVVPRRTVSSPIIVDGLILISCGEGAGNHSVVALEPYAAGGQPKVAYQLDRTTAPYVPSIVAHRDLVFLWGDKGIVTCVEAKTGKIQWRERVGGNYFGSPVRVADRLYCMSAEGDVVSLAAARDFALLGRSPLGESSRSTPAVAGGRMFLRSESHLAAIGEK